MCAHSYRLSSSASYINCPHIITRVDECTHLLRSRKSSNVFVTIISRKCDPKEDNWTAHQPTVEGMTWAGVWLPGIVTSMNPIWAFLQQHVRHSPKGLYTAGWKDARRRRTKCGLLLYCLWYDRYSHVREPSQWVAKRVYKPQGELQCGGGIVLLYLLIRIPFDIGPAFC